MWNVDQSLLLNDAEKRTARKNIGLADAGSENIPIYFNSAGDPLKMGHTTETNSKWPSGGDSGIPMVKTTSNSVCAGWAALSTSSYYGVAVEVGSGQTNRGLWSTIPNQSSGATASIDDNWLIAKGASRNSIFLNRHPAASDSDLCDFANNGGGYAFARLVSPNWNNIRTSGIYSIYNSSAPGTNGSPDSGRVCLLVGDAYSVNATSGLPGTSATDHYTTQLAMGGDMLYRTKVGNADWESWRPVLTQYKDTLGSTGTMGYKLVATDVGETEGDQTHYTALINITPLARGSDYNEPYVAYLEIFQEKQGADYKDKTLARIKMLSTPSYYDSGTYTPFRIRGTNNGSTGNYKHEWYLCRDNEASPISNCSITVTPILSEGTFDFKGLQRVSSVPTTSSYIVYGESTPAVARFIKNQTVYSAFDSTSGLPLYLTASGALAPCDASELSKTVNGTSVGDTKTPVYIDSSGSPATCTIRTGSLSGGAYHNLVNHMYTSVPVCNDSSGNKGGAHTNVSDVVICDETFPSEYIPSYSPRSWPAGIMIMAGVSVYINNASASYIDIQLYQGSTSIGVHRFNMPSNTFANYLTANFFGITVAQIDSSTHFYIKVGSPDGDATVGAYTFTLRAMI